MFNTKKRIQNEKKEEERKKQEQRFSQLYCFAYIEQKKSFSC